MILQTKSVLERILAILCGIEQVLDIRFCLAWHQIEDLAKAEITDEAERKKNQSI